MKYREIRQTGVKVSEISLGCWTMGGLNWVDGSPNGWANVDEDEVTKAIEHAIDSGVNHFDNADAYGNGKAERMLARVLDRLGVATNDFVIATKTGHFPGTAAHGFDPLHIRHQCEQSLKNLGRDYADIYYLHHGDFGENDMYLEGAAEMVHRLRDEGKIRLIGQSAYSAADFAKTIPVVKPDVLQTWAHALDDQFISDGSELVQLMEEHDLKVVAFSPLAQGRLLDKYDPDNPPQFDEGDNRKQNPAFGSEGLAKLQPILAKLKGRFGSTVEDLAAMALGYVLAHDRVQCVIPGFRNLKQVKANLVGAERGFTDEDRAFVAEAVS